MENLPKIVGDRLRLEDQSKQAEHPDANLLAAFAEQSLPSSEHGRVLGHLARCRECRSVVVLAQPELAEIIAGVDESVPLHAGEYVSRGKSFSAQVTLGNEMPELPAETLKSRSPRRLLSWQTLRWGALAACVILVAAVVTIPRFSQRPPATLSQQTEIVAIESRKPSPAPNEQTASGQERTVADLSAAEEKKSRKLQLEPGSRAVIAGKLAEPHGTRASLEEKGIAGRRELARRESAKAADEFAMNRPQASPAAAPPPAMLDKIAAARAGQKEAPPQSAAGSVPGTSSETAAIELQPSPAGMPESSKNLPATAKAKEVAPGKEDLKANVAQAPVFGGMLAQKKTSVEAETSLRANENHTELSPRWTVAADGSLQFSRDQGKTWNRAAVGEKDTKFRAVAVIGSQVWAGGSKGSLFHSVDRGSTWIRVKPSWDGFTLADDITSLDFSDARHGKVSTANHEVWTTADGGQTWTKQ
jgi:hypothetical protein